MHSDVMSPQRSSEPIELFNLTHSTVKCPPVEEKEWTTDEAWEDVDGRDLDPAKVKAARKDEIDIYNKMKLKHSVNKNRS